MKENTNLSFIAAGLVLICGCKSKSTSSTTDSIAAKATNSVKVDASAKSANNLKPKGAAPTWAPDITPQMRAVIEKLESFGNWPITRPAGLIHKMMLESC